MHVNIEQHLQFTNLCCNKLASNWSLDFFSNLFQEKFWKLKKDQRPKNNFMHSPSNSLLLPFVWKMLN